MNIENSGLNFEHAVDYHYDRFPPSNLNYEKLFEPFGEAIEAISRFDQMLKNMHNSSILLTPLRNQEAVISSRMEGTVSTMDEILRYEAELKEGDKGHIGTRSEVIETIMYRHSLTSAQKAIEEGQPISDFLIKQAHQKLLSIGRGASKSPGEYKKDQNYIADRSRKNILFIPISPLQLVDGVEKLFHYLETSDHQTLIKIAVAHIEFEALHPFMDGNGRIGRMLITLLMWKYNVISAPHFYVSGYLEEKKDLYIDTMRRVSSHDDWTSWCLFFMKAVKEQANRNLEVAESIRSLYEEMKVIFAETLASQWSVQALDFIFTNPVFRNNSFTNSGIIPYNTALRFSKVLVEKGLLRTIEPASGRRPALYAFEPLIELVRV